MQRRIFLLTLRAAAAIAATGFVIAHARIYMLRDWRFSVPIPIYTIAAYSLLLIVLWLSTRTLIRQLMTSAATKRPVSRTNQSTINDSPVETIHRYPLLLTLLVVSAGLIVGAVPYLMRNIGEPIGISTYVVCFGVACILFAIAIHLLTYRVVTKLNGIVIRTTLGTREIALTEIQEATVVKTRNGSQIVVLLKNNKVIRFGRALTGFTTLLESLAAKAPGSLARQGSAS
jgi:hypothetical protein